MPIMWTVCIVWILYHGAVWILYMMGDVIGHEHPGPVVYDGERVNILRT